MYGKADMGGLAAVQMAGSSTALPSVTLPQEWQAFASGNGISADDFYVTTLAEQGKRRVAHALRGGQFYSGQKQLKSSQLEDMLLALTRSNVNPRFKFERMSLKTKFIMPRPSFLAKLQAAANDAGAAAPVDKHDTKRRQLNAASSVAISSTPKKSAVVTLSKPVAPTAIKSRKRVKRQHSTNSPAALPAPTPTASTHVGQEANRALLRAGQVELPAVSPSGPLQSGLNSILQTLNLQRDVKNKNLAVTLVDVTNPDPSKHTIASVNGDMHTYAASLPKIAILLTASHLGLVNDKNRNTFERMIRVSSNASARKAIAIIGAHAPSGRSTDRLFDKYQRGMRTIMETLEGYDLVQGGKGLSILKPYTGKDVRQQLKNHRWAGMETQGASTNAAARLYYLLHNDALPNSELMDHTMSSPGHSHHFMEGLDSLGVNRSQVQRKSGKLGTGWRADSVTVSHQGRKYILITMAKPGSDTSRRETAAPGRKNLGPFGKLVKGVHKLIEEQHG